MNGSGLLVLNAPWKFDEAMQPVLRALRHALGEKGPGHARLEWLRAPG
jgi:23S rRNA (adenine2030-N6)-methyltransferase